MDAINLGAPLLTDMLDAHGLARLRALAVRRHYTDGQIVHERGDTEAQMCLVVSGGVRLVRRRADGHVVMLSVMTAGSHFGDNVAVNGQPRTHDGVANGATVVDHFGADAFARIMREEPAILLALYRIAAHRLNVAIGLFDDVRRLSPKVRVAKVVARALLNARAPGRLECLQDDIAQMLGLSSVSVGRALNDLQKLGLLKTGYRCIEVPDTARFDAWVNAQDP